MSIQQIQLTNYDTVVAVTQNSVNEMLATYLYQLQKNVALYYGVNSQGQYVPTTEQDAVFTFTGTLNYAVQGGTAVDIVELYVDGQPQAVRYNITFSNAEFKSVGTPPFDVKQAGGDPWIIKFLVNLSLKPVTLSSLPSGVQQAVNKYVGDLGPDMFSIQQLYIDLNTAIFDTFQNIENMNSFAASIFTGIMQSYMAQQQQQGGIVFGYALQATQAGQQTPTFMPTALDFCVTPYTDSNGQHSKPGLDTLNYLVMTGKRPLPPDVPPGFGWNWVDDPTIQGAMAVRHDLIISYLVPQFNSILQTISPTLAADAKEDKVTFGTGSSSNQFTVHDPPQPGGVVATYSYGTSAKDSGSSVGVMYDVSSDYSSTCQIAFSGDTITLSGTITCSASEHVYAMGSDNETDMPATTYSWSATLQLQMNLAENGSLDIVVANSDFDSKPTVANHDQSWWEKLIEGFGGGMQQYVNDFGGIQGQVQTTLNNVLPAIKSALSTMNDFVFPGASTFAFKNPQFSGDLDLASNITYLST